MEPNEASIFDDIKIPAPALWKRIVLIGWIMLWHLLLILVPLAGLYVWLVSNRQIDQPTLIVTGVTGLMAVSGIIIRRLYGWLVAAALFYILALAAAVTLIDAVNIPAMFAFFAVVAVACVGNLVLLSTRILRRFYKLPEGRAIGRFYGIGFAIAAAAMGLGLGIAALLRS